MELNLSNKKRNNVLYFAVLLLLFSIIFIMIYVPMKMNERARNGEISKAKIKKMIRLPKGGLSIHVSYSVNNTDYIGYINTDVKFLNMFGINDSVFIKYDHTDFSNVILITDSLK